MPYLESNEPYQRVDNGIVNGFAAGAAIGAAMSGAVYGGAYLHMKGIPKSVERKLENYHNNVSQLKAERELADKEFNNRINEINKRGIDRATSLKNSPKAKNDRTYAKMKELFNNFKQFYDDREKIVVDKEHERAINALNKRRNKLDKKYNKFNHPDYIQNKMNNHIFHKMHSWRGLAVGTGITALSASIGAAIKANDD